MPISFGSGAGQYPVIIHPGQQRCIFAIEDASYGTPSTSTAKTFLEPVTTITTAIQRTPYEANEYIGVPATLFDMIETTHHSTVTISVPWRSNGIAAWALSAMMGSSLGGATDVATTPTGWPALTGGQVAHLITPNNANNVCNTITIWHDAGDGGGSSVFTGVRGLLQMSACTVESIRFTFTPNTAVTAEITLQGNFPIFRQVASGSTGIQNGPTVTPTKLSGADATYKATRMMGFQGQSAYFLIRTSAQNTTVYANKILSADMTITRTVEVIESPYSQTPTYFLPGPLSVTGTMNMLFDGLGDLTNTYPVNAGSNVNTDLTLSNSIYQDYLNFKRTGTSANPNELRYIDNDNNGFDFTFWPIKWTSFGLNTGAQSLQVNAGFTSFNDLSLAAPNSGTSKISSIQNVSIVNNVPATTMIA